MRCDQTLLEEMRCFFKDLYDEDLEYINPRIDKYGRCEFNGQKFSSDFNSTDRGSVVKGMFVDIDDKLCPYFGLDTIVFHCYNSGEKHTNQMSTRICYMAEIKV